MKGIAGLLSEVPCISRETSPNETEIVKLSHSAYLRRGKMLVASTVRGTDGDINRHVSANETICNENGKHPTTSDRYTRHSCERSHFTSFQAGSHSRAHVYRICNTWGYARETRVRQSRKILFPSAPRR